MDQVSSHAVNFGGVNDGIWAHDKALRTFAHNDTKFELHLVCSHTCWKGCGTTLKHWFMGLPDVKRRKKYIVKTSSGADFRYENGHGHVLGDDANACYIFAVRDPIARWVSGFLSNARMGCPDHFHLHNINEAAGLFSLSYTECFSRIAISCKEREDSN